MRSLPRRDVLIQLDFRQCQVGYFLRQAGFRQLPVAIRREVVDFRVARHGGNPNPRKELHDLVDGEGFNPGDLVVLSPVPFTQSWTSLLSENTRSSITVLTDASPRNMNRHTIRSAQIGDFKRLESEEVVLVDMPSPGHREPLRSLHYVGMSRARAVEYDLLLMVLLGTAS